MIIWNPLEGIIEEVDAIYDNMNNWYSEIYDNLKERHIDDTERGYSEEFKKGYEKALRDVGRVFESKFK